MKLEELIDIIHPPGSPKRPTAEQKQILEHPSGPAWVLAGPGSGKTEVLTMKVLRLLFVEGDSMQSSRVPPESIFVTTFTDKAARNLQDRIGLYRDRLLAAVPALSAIDVSKVRVGTLHGLANDLLQQARAASYRNVRLMDPLETAMFVHENMSIIRKADRATDTDFWAHFEFMFSPREWKRTMNRLPLQWDMALRLIQLFGRICDDRKNTSAMKAAGGPIGRLADLYMEYQQHLTEQHRCDFSQLQQRFLDFLQTPVGTRIRDGVASEPTSPGITHVLVDEYQDTNLIQEAIYFSLANRAPFNLTVVGDDDQAMYRFRGGSVECMVTFDQACQLFFGIPASSVAKYPLVGNFRSHKSIVEFCDKYVTAFASMAQPGARAPGKLPLQAKGTIGGAYTAVGTLTGSTIAVVASSFAQAVLDLKQKGVIADYSQVCLLLGSTRESPRNAGPFADELRRLGIPVYNPRSRTFLDQSEVAGLLGCLMLMLDPDGAHQPKWAPDELPQTMQAFRKEALVLKANNKALSDYIDSVRACLTAKSDVYLDSTLQELVYYLLALPPFDQMMQAVGSRIRLANLTKLIESFASIPVQGQPTVFRGNLRSNPDRSGSVLPAWLVGFYQRFFGYLAKSGVNDLEDEAVIAPPGHVPIMTMHQAKGLEFPFVFVGHLGEKSKPDATHVLEDMFSTVPNESGRVFPALSAETRAELDTVRQYYVAYSRAEHALVLLGTAAQLKGGGTPCGPNKTWLQQHAMPL